MRLIRIGTRGVLIGAIALAALLIVAACSSGSSGGSGSSGAGGSTGTTGTSAAAGGAQVTATLTEFKIALSKSSFTPGTYTFVATNAGSATHALEITGPGVSNARTGTVSPGQSANLTVTLRAGSYDVFCPIDGHKGLGMDLTLTVGGAAATTSATTTTSSAGGGGYGY
ncbi:MAG TPA: sulfocyanin-like copper-binding protein [Pseudonocardiaceae bacterium]|jgi:plastocyanin|nr:sulfocyanin-like copper-binding protein [Pseudonocardiaceae bacterium]